MRRPISPLLVVLLFIGGHMTTDLAVPCHRRFFPEELSAGASQPLDLCPKDSYADTWTKTSGGPKCIKFGDRLVRPVPRSTCEPHRNATQLPGRVWLMNSVPELGLMIHDFTQMVEFFETLPRGANVTVLWGTLHMAGGFRQQWAQPFVDLLIRYYRQRRNITAVQLSSTSEGFRQRAFWSAMVRSYTCIWQKHPPFHGNCAGFFNSLTGPIALRRMVAHATGAKLSMRACYSGPWTPLSVLLFDRERRRMFRNPKKMVHEVNSTLRQAWPAREIQFQYLKTPPVGLVAQCRLFARFDFIIMAHGAAMSNLICARPCAMVAEIGWGARSKWLFLRKPMMLHSCFVGVTNRSQFYGHIEPTNLTSCLHRFIDLHS